MIQVLDRTQFTSSPQLWEQWNIGFTADRPIYDLVEAINLADAAWFVYKKPLGCYLNGLDGIERDDNYFHNTKLFGIFREDDNVYLGHVGSGFKIVQNIHGFNWFAPMLAERKAYIESGGTLNRGQIVWLIARTADSSTPHIGGDPAYALQQRVLLTLCHNTERAPRVSLINTCNSVMLPSAVLTSGHFRLRQTKSIDRRLAELSDRFLITAEDRLELDCKFYDRLAKIQIGKQAINRHLEYLFADVLTYRRTDGTYHTKTLEENKKTQQILTLIAETPNYPERSYISAWEFFYALARYESFYAIHNRRPKDRTKQDAQLEKLWFADSGDILEKASDYLQTL